MTNVLDEWGCSYEPVNEKGLRKLKTHIVSRYVRRVRRNDRPRNLGTDPVLQPQASSVSPSGEVEQYLCQSYFEDNQVQNCTCGKCK